MEPARDYDDHFAFLFSTACAVQAVTCDLLLYELSTSSLGDGLDPCTYPVRVMAPHSQGTAKPRLVDSLSPLA